MLILIFAFHFLLKPQYIAGSLICVSFTVVDSLESIDQDYVIVSGPPLDFSSSARASNPSHFPSKTDSLPLDSGNMNTSTGLGPIIGGATHMVDYSGSLQSRISSPRTSQVSMDIANPLEQPSTDSMTRIKSLQHYASSITALVNEKVTCSTSFVE